MAAGKEQFQYNKRVIFERMVKSGSVLLNLGANVGFYSLLGSILVGSKGMFILSNPFLEIYII